MNALNLENESDSEDTEDADDDRYVTVTKVTTDEWEHVLNFIYDRCIPQFPKTQYIAHATIGLDHHRTNSIS